MSGRGRKIPVLNVVAYVIIIVGLLLFFMTPLFIKFLNFDTDILGILVVIVGVAVLIVGGVVRLVIKKTRNQKTAGSRG